MAWTHEHVEVLTAVIVTLATLIHAVRSVMQWSLQLGPYTVPQWVSWLLVLIAGYVSVHFWRKIAVANKA